MFSFFRGRGRVGHRGRAPFPVNENDMAERRVDDVPNDIEISSWTPQDVFQVAILLTRLNLPKDLIPHILEYGGFAAHRIAALNDEEFSVRENHTGSIHSKARLPTDIHPKSVRAVVFETVSHDQGWSSYPQHRGTYADSWTWLEARFLDDKADVDVDNPINGFPTIVTNVHGSNRFRRHRVKWSRSDQDARIQKALDRSEAGETIAIQVHARYPGWINHVASTSIAFEYLPVRKVP